MLEDDLHFLGKSGHFSERNFCGFASLLTHANNTKIARKKWYDLRHREKPESSGKPLGCHLSLMIFLSSLPSIVCRKHINKRF